MPTGKEDLLQALVEAFIMEKGTREFYLQAAARSSAGGAKKAFAELAEWEAQHMAFIQSLYQSLMDDRELMEFSEFSRTVPAPVAESGMPVKDLEKRIETPTIKDEKDAVTLALGIEAKAFALYRDLVNKAQDPETKVIFEEMMEQETKHRDHLTRLRKELPA